MIIYARTVGVPAGLDINGSIRVGWAWCSLMPLKWLRC